MREVKRKIKEIQPDIIHLHSPRATFLGMMTKFLTFQKSKIVVTAHGWIPDRLKLMKLYEYLYVQSIKRSDKIVAVSNQVKEILIKHNVDPDRVAVIHNGIEVSDSVVVQKPLLNKKRFIFLGRFIEEKGVIFLLNAVERLHLKFPGSFDLSIYGEGPLLSQIEETVAHKKLSNISIHGFVQPDEVIKLLNKHDIFLISSVQEGFPYTLLEALSAGLTVISTDVGGIKEALHDCHNGFLVPAKDENKLVQVMEKMISMSEEELYQFKLRAHSTRLNFTVKNMIGMVENEYERLIK